MEGAAFEVVDFVVGVEAAGLEDGGEVVAGGGGVVFDVGGLFVAGAVDGAAADAAAGEDAGVGEGPMVAAVVAVDVGGASEFADAGDDGFVEEASEGEVFEEGAVGLVEGGEAVAGGEHFVAVHAAFEITDAAVDIPDVVDLGSGSDEHPVDSDEADASFDESSGGEEAFAVFVAAVAVAGLGGFAFEVEGVFDGGGADEAVGIFVDAAVDVGGGIFLEGAVLLFEDFEEAATSLHAGDGDFVGEREWDRGLGGIDAGPDFDVIEDFAEFDGVVDGAEEAAVGAGIADTVVSDGSGDAEAGGE